MTICDVPLSSGGGGQIPFETPRVEIQDKTHWWRDSGGPNPIKR